MATVLVIDDDDGMRYLMTLVLEKAGHRVLGAENGRTGIDAFHREPIDVVVVDLLMPQMGGVAFIRWLRTEQKKTTPAILLTSFEGDEALGSAMEAGATEILQKPIRLATFVDSVVRHCAKNP